MIGSCDSSLIALKTADAPRAAPAAAPAAFGAWQTGAAVRRKLPRGRREPADTIRLWHLSTAHAARLPRCHKACCNGARRPDTQPRVAEATCAACDSVAPGVRSQEAAPPHSSPCAHASYHIIGASSTITSLRHTLRQRSPALLLDAAIESERRWHRGGCRARTCGMRAQRESSATATARTRALWMLPTSPRVRPHVFEPTADPP